VPERTGRQEATHVLREWAGGELRRVSNLGGRELGTVRCEWQSTGIGFPQTVGEFDEPIQAAISPEHYELTFLLPAEAQQLAVELPEKLREAMASDETLGDQLHIAEIPPGVIEPEDGDNEDYEASIRIRIPVTVFIGP
jgi:hypothetical protein